ncbi:hypothetical protein HYC85_018077 [Camellia sinensis]|uniref:Non-haem dioxygenase N-terminal domain-containing protein n=1 Tax=Camellia sinensis TaxID=4442 RepID=A0A7J7GTJ3_CAMSI|nr:hypothetical protein HYC85_018077 [Camellia sinensis]
MASSKAKGVREFTDHSRARQRAHACHPRALHNEPCPILSEDATSQTIPTVDMQQLLMVEATDFQLDKLHSICKEWGIFQIAIIEENQKGVQLVQLIDYGVF